jgi:hypothetical protein
LELFSCSSTGIDYYYYFLIYEFSIFKGSIPLRSSVQVNWNIPLFFHTAKAGSYFNGWLAPSNTFVTVLRPIP